MCITPNDNSFSAKTDDAARINEAIKAACTDGSRLVKIPKYNAANGSCVWELESSILLPDNFTLLLDNCYIRMADGTFCNAICNENCYAEHTEENIQHNIYIKGIGHAVLDGGNYNGYSEHSKNLPKPLHNNCTIVLSNVEDFAVENINVTNHRYWGLCFLYCSHGTVRNIDFKADLSCADDCGGHTAEYLPPDYEHVYLQNSDGIDLRMGCHDILIENISGFTVDDTVALTALCGKEELKHRVPGKSNDIHDIIIKNIRSYTFCWTGQLRLLAKSGCRIYSISADTVVNTIDESLPYRGGCSVMLGDSGYIKERDIKMGELFNIKISNIHSRAIRAVRLTGPMSYVSLDKIYVYNGTRAVIHSDSDTEFKNVKITDIFCGETAELDSVINFGENVKGKIQVSGVYCEKAKHLLRNSGVADVQMSNINAECSGEKITVEPMQYAFWWADKQ